MPYYVYILRIFQLEGMRNTYTHHRKLINLVYYYSRQSDRIKLFGPDSALSLNFAFKPKKALWVNWSVWDFTGTGYQQDIHTIVGERDLIVTIKLACQVLCILSILNWSNQSNIYHGRLNGIAIPFLTSTQDESQVTRGNASY